MIAQLLYVALAVALVQARPQADVEVEVVEVLPNGCPADWDVYKYLPHESNATEFYHCISGERFLRPCPEGTVFNAELEMCDFGSAGIVARNTNSGSNNSGQNNSGPLNSGSNNSGRGNTGNNNSGNFNSGNNNSGSYNSGSHNSGSHNTGDRNTGSHNTGTNNSGNGNSSNNNSGSNNNRQN